MAKQPFTQPQAQFSKWSYTAACVNEALEANAPERIPMGVLIEAADLLGSAKKVAFRDPVVTSEDFARHAVVVSIVAYNLNAVCGCAETTMQRINEHISYLYQLMCSVSSQTDDRALMRFFHALAEKCDRQNYDEAMVSRHKHLS